MADHKRDQGPDLSDVLNALGLGESSLESSVTNATDTRVWRVRHDGRSLAIRQFRAEQRAMMAVEIEAMQLARSGGIPVPAILTSGLVRERYPAMALEWVQGVPAAESLLHHPRLAKRLGRNSGRILARIHQLPTASVQEIPEASLYWKIRNVPAEPELEQRIADALAIPPALLHLDFHPFNLMTVGGRLSGVLDWTNAAIGDPRLDVARSVSILRTVAPAFVGLRGARRLRLGLFVRAFLRGYQAVAGPIRDMAPFYATAGQLLVADLSPKIHLLPVEDPAALSRSMHAWTDHWRERALRD